MIYKIPELRIFYKKPEKISLFRPLLPFNRREVTKLCIFWGLPIYCDTTNKLTCFRRNRLRQQVLPVLRLFFNPKVDTALARLISVTNSENNYFYYQIKDFKKFFKIKSFYTQLLKQNRKPIWAPYLPEDLQRKLYKEFLNSNFRRLTFNEIEFLLHLNFRFLNKNSKVKNKIF